MKRSEMVKFMVKKLSEWNDTIIVDEYDMSGLLSEMENAGMEPPLIPTGASGWEVGKGMPSYINEWEKE